MSTLNNQLEQDYEVFWKRLGAVPVPKDQLKKYTDHVEQVVIPEIVQTIRNRIPTQEEIRRILY